MPDLAAASSLPVTHVSERYVVVDKPSGLLSVPGKGPEKADCVAARVVSMFPWAAGPLIVHRLDMETSGLMVLGLDPAAQQELSAAFERRRVAKRYVALVERDVAGESGTIDLPIRADIDRRPYQVVDRMRGRRAVTHWRVLSREIDRTRIEFDLETGRTHQLRVHAAHPEGLGHPIVGDVLYGDGGAERLMLHAAVLEFNEPGTHRRVRFTSRAPF